MKPVRVLILILCTIAVTLQAQQKSYPIETIDGKDYYRYTVEKGVGLYRLSINFDVTQEQILEANPKLMQTGLQYGTIILIPVSKPISPPRELSQSIEPEETSHVVEPKVESVEESVQVVELPSIQQEAEKTIRVMEVFEENPYAELLSHPLFEGFNINELPAKDTLTIALLLPLQVQVTKRTPAIERFLEYYMGVLIAIYEEQQSNEPIKLCTYDVGKNVQVLQNLFESDSLKDVDAIIGPAYAQQIEKVFEYVQNDSIWVLVPFYSELNDFQSNPYVLQFNASNRTQADALAQYLYENVEDINVVLVQSKHDESIPNSIQCVRDALLAYQIPTTTATIHGILHDSLSFSLVDGKENIIIFNTEKYNNLSVVMPYLRKCSNNYRLTLYSRYSWQQEEIGIPQIYTSIFRQDLEIPYQYKYVFQRFFAAEPTARFPRYDLLGYDQTKQLLSILRDPSAITVEEVWLGIQSNVSYQPSSAHAGYENVQVNVIRK